MKKVLTILLGLLLLMAVTPQMYAIDDDVGVGIEFVQSDAVQQSVFALEMLAVPVADCISMHSAPFLGLTIMVAIRSIDTEISTLKNKNDLLTVSREVDYPLMFSTVKTGAGTIA